MRYRSTFLQQPLSPWLPYGYQVDADTIVCCSYLANVLVFVRVG